MTVHILGVDPGLVHTGCVRITIDPTYKVWSVNHKVVVGVDAAAIAEVKYWATKYHEERHVFIEAYRPRSHFANDARMGKAVNDLKREIPGSIALDNTGVTKVVRPPLMRLLGVWNFSTPTHHQDLRSAARIGLYGALKDPILNLHLTNLVWGILENTGWRQT